MLFYVIYGQFPQEPQISGHTYRTCGVPPEIELRRLTRAQTAVFPFCDDEFGKLLSEQNSDLFPSMRQSRECLTLQGEVSDPADLNYLRDCIGVVSYFMDHGGLAVLDPQQLRLYDRSEWLQTFFAMDEPNVFRHVTILYSDEPSGGGRWYHTRGMRKFGRPDLSLRNVPAPLDSAAVDICNRFIELQALGDIVPEGQEIRINSLPPGMSCHHQGSLDDPDFNNLHIEISFPKNT